MIQRVDVNCCTARAHAVIWQGSACNARSDQMGREFEDS